jgi:hypothetical protein
MLIISSKINSKGKQISSVRRVKGEYDAKKIYLAWEEITKDFFGNGKISIIGAGKFESSSFTWTNVIDESAIMNASGINI